ncbi:MAG: hypothetical protein WCL44_08630 [bacterium]
MRKLKQACEQGEWFRLRCIGVTLTTILFLTPSVVAVTSNDLINAVLSFPPIGVHEGYRPDLAVKSANALIAAKPAMVLETLRLLAGAKYSASKRPTEERICCLCRLIFVPSGTNTMLVQPNFGFIMLFPHRTRLREFACSAPFAIIEDVPLSFTIGPCGAGSDAAQQYLEYCASNGVLRTKPFPIPTIATTSNAVEKLVSEVLSSPQETGWERDLISDKDDVRGIWQQVKNMAEPRGDLRNTEDAYGNNKSDTSNAVIIDQPAPMMARGILQAECDGLRAIIAQQEKKAESLRAGLRKGTTQESDIKRQEDIINDLRADLKRLTAEGVADGNAIPPAK